MGISFMTLLLLLFSCNCKKIHIEIQKSRCNYLAEPYTENHFSNIFLLLIILYIVN